MTNSPYDCIVAELHRDSFEVMERRRYGEAHPFAEGLLPRFLRGGYDIVVFVVGGDSVTHRAMSDRPLEGSLDVMDFFLNECQTADGAAGIIKHKEDVPTEPVKDQVWFLMELEGGRPFQEDYASGRKMHERLATLRAFYRMGLRSVQLTHNGRNELADGMHDWHTGGGLSEFGVAVIHELNRLHMLVGVSHLTDRCFEEVLEVSSAPVIASHCNARAVLDHRRNWTDDQLRALARNGGILGIHFLAMMLVEKGDDRNPTLEDFLQHIDHVAEFIGPQYLGFGILGNDPTYTSVFPHTARDTIRTPEHPEGLEYFGQAALLMDGLAKRGYSIDEIHGIMGGNFARVARQVLPSRGHDPIW
jgi:membrane dipeptidase